MSALSVLDNVSVTWDSEKYLLVEYISLADQFVVVLVAVKTSCVICLYKSLTPPPIQKFSAWVIKPAKWKSQKDIFSLHVMKDMCQCVLLAIVSSNTVLILLVGQTAAGRHVKVQNEYF